VFLGSFSKDSLVGGAFVLREKEECVALGLENRLNVVLTELKDGRGRLSLHESHEFIVFHLTIEDNLRLVKVTENSDSRGSHAMLLSALGTSMEEGEFLNIGVLGSAHEYIEDFTFGGTEVDEVQFSSSLISDSSAFDQIRGVSGLFGNPRDNGVSGATAIVFGVLAVNKPFERGEALDREALTKSFLFGCVDFSKEHWGLLCAESCSG